jgi:hypothetical protein
MRLIDADALKEFIDDCGICAICPHKAPRCSYDCDFPDFVTEKWNVAIDAQPTIDAVSVVRCRECKHRQNPYAPKWCYEMSKETDADDYCSYGERKESE